MNLPRYLFTRYVLRSFSQAMQDRWCIDHVHRGKRGGFFVDFGAYDGVKFSNTLLLERAYGWNGICIEPNPRAFERLAAQRRCAVVNCAVGSSSGKLTLTDQAMVSTVAPGVGGGDGTFVVDARRLDEILEEQGAPSTIDFMSVDVEGFEDDALLTFPFDRWRVLAMCVERPSAALMDCLRASGLRERGSIEGLDWFFVHRDLAHVDPFTPRPWTRFELRLEAAIHRLEHWGLLEGDAADWGSDAGRERS